MLLVRFGFKLNSTEIYLYDKLIKFITDDLFNLFASNSI